MVTSNSITTVGRDANLQSFAEHFAARPDVRYRRTPSEVKVFAPWAMASEAGRWIGSWKDADGSITIGGPYFAKWRRVEGQWLVESEVYVPDQCSGGRYCQVSPGRP